MCVVSMIGDHYKDRLFPYEPYTFPYRTTTTNGDVSEWFKPQVSKEEFEALKKEVENMKELLKRAKLYDEKNNEPDCEIEEKMVFLRRIAELVGINLDEVIKPKEA